MIQINFVDTGLDDRILKSIPVDNCPEELMKAVRDRTKLVPKVIVDKNGTRRTVFVRPDKDSKKDKGNSNSDNEYKGDEAVERIRKLKEGSVIELTTKFRGSTSIGAYTLKKEMNNSGIISLVWVKTGGDHNPKDFSTHDTAVRNVITPFTSVKIKKDVDASEPNKSTQNTKKTPNSSNKNNSKKTTPNAKSEPFESYVFDTGRLSWKFKTLDELKQKLEDYGLPSYLANLDMKNLNKRTNYVENNYQHFHVIGYPHKDTNNSNSSQKSTQSTKKNNPASNKNNSKPSKDKKTSDTSTQKPQTSAGSSGNNSGNNSSNSKKLSYYKASDATKQKVMKATDGMSGDEVVKMCKDKGIEWEEHSHKGINNMRAKMALAKYFDDGGK